MMRPTNHVQRVHSSNGMMQVNGVLTILEAVLQISGSGSMLKGFNKFANART